MEEEEGKNCEPERKLRLLLAPTTAKCLWFPAGPISRADGEIFVPPTRNPRNLASPPPGKCQLTLHLETRARRKKWELCVRPFKLGVQPGSRAVGSTLLCFLLRCLSPPSLLSLMHADCMSALPRPLLLSFNARTRSIS